MYQFKYHRASSLDEAANLRSGADDGVFIAGGMTLIPTLKARLAAPSDVIDLSDIDDLDGISVGNDAVSIGAMTRHADVAVSADVRRSAIAAPSAARSRTVIRLPIIRPPWLR